MSILSSLSAIVPSLPNFYFCTNMNCSGARIACCSENNQKPFQLQSHDITENYIASNQYAKFKSNTDGLIVKFADPSVAQKTDMTAISYFVDTTRHERLADRQSISKLKLNDNYAIVEFKPKLNFLKKHKECTGVIVYLSEDEWRAFSAK